jgi:hypothetical protein
MLGGGDSAVGCVPVIKVVEFVVFALDVELAAAAVFEFGMEYEALSGTWAGVDGADAVEHRHDAEQCIVHRGGHRPDDEGTMAAGSFLAISAVTSTDTDPAVIAQIENAYANATAVIFRTANHIRSWFNRMDLVHPGVVDVTHWPARIGVPTDVRILGGLAWKR